MFQQNIYTDTLDKQYTMCMILPTSTSCSIAAVYALYPATLKTCTNMQQHTRYGSFLDVLYWGLYCLSDTPIKFMTSLPVTLTLAPQSYTQGHKSPFMCSSVREIITRQHKTPLQDSSTNHVLLHPPLLRECECSSSLHFAPKMQRPPLKF